MTARKTAHRVCPALLAGVLASALALAPSAARAEAPSFGIASFAIAPTSAQAGAHADLSTAIALNTNASGEPIGQLKDVQVNLPSGVVGNPLATPRCTQVEFEAYGCQPLTQVGILKIDFHVGQAIEPVPIALYNLTPTAGHLATLGAAFLFAKIVIQVEMRQDGTYGLGVGINDLSTLIPITGTEMTLWGVPASPVHDLERSRTQIGGPQPIYGAPNEFGEREIIGIEPTPAGVAPVPFLTNPTHCSEPSPTTLSVDSWQSPGQYVTQTATFPAMSGCSLLRIAPSLSVAPDTTQQDTPSGYAIDLSYPLNEEPYGLATPNLRNVTFTLPAGTSLSPGVANGLVGCSDEQFSSGACPNASQVGTVTLSTPFLPDHLTGTVNIGTPTAAAMYRIFVSASADNVTFHLSGVARPDPSTGQVVVSFEETPQLPFSDLDLHLFGGPEAVFANPAACGPASTTGELLSYAGQSASPSSSFTVDADGSGGACPAVAPFTPSLSAGTISPLAGSPSPFTLTVSRGDGQQNLSTIAAQLPPGLLGMLSQVPSCAEPQASTGSCSQAAQIGSIAIGAGAGTQPLDLTGPVYLTGPYAGAPFGLAMVVPATAGPFDLGTIVVRAKILVNPNDMHLTIVSDPLPQIIDGIPLRLRTVSLTIDRAGFISNPTDCTPQTITATIGSAQGASATLATPFQVAGCRALPFAPRLTVATQAHASGRGDGASLDVTVATAAGTRANIRTVIVDLPKQLRPRLTTIQKACPTATFHTNPRACPAEALVGSVTVDTPVLSSPLTGPIYLVTLGGSASPDLVMVPQGQGIKVELEGALDISSKGSVSAAFRALPDVPISSFHLEFPRGPHSMLGATEAFCPKALSMPYMLTGQNGAQIERTTRVAVSGCPKHRDARKTRGASSAVSSGPTGRHSSRHDRSLVAITALESGSVHTPLVASTALENGSRP